MEITVQEGTQVARRAKNESFREQTKNERASSAVGGGDEFESGNKVRQGLEGIDDIEGTYHSDLSRITKTF
jgi:hypothetical protein